MRRALAPVLLACSLLLACDKSSAPPGSNGAVSAGVGSPGGTNPDATVTGGLSTPDPQPNQATDPPPATGPACGDKTCAADEECISYYGIAGPRGPKFEECGIRCKADGGCPDGKKCQTIADGPGPVCR